MLQLKDSEKKSHSKLCFVGQVVREAQVLGEHEELLDNNQHNIGEEVGKDKQSKLARARPKERGAFEEGSTYMDRDIAKAAIPEYIEAHATASHEKVSMAMKGLVLAKEAGQFRLVELLRCSLAQPLSFREAMCWMT